jgi:hypothetical protein
MDTFADKGRVRQKIIALGASIRRPKWHAWGSKSASYKARLAVEKPSICLSQSPSNEALVARIGAVNAAAGDMRRALMTLQVHSAT